MKTYRVSFLGHVAMEDYFETERQLMRTISDLLHTHEAVTFQVRWSGVFDSMAASCVKRMQQHYGKDKAVLKLVLPHPAENMAYFQAYYDEILVLTAAERGTKGEDVAPEDRWLLEQAELLVVCNLDEACLRLADGLQKARVRL